jgi:aminoglycoside phosphotransferase (APT) family kinase protein
MIRGILSRMSRGLHAPIQPADERLHAELARDVLDDVSARLGTACELDEVHATRTGSLTIRFRADRPYIAKLPLKASTEPRLRRNAETLKSFGQLRWVSSYLAARYPAVVLLGKVSGYFYSVETHLPGRDGASILKAGGNVQELILSAEGFLSKLQMASMEGPRLGVHRWSLGFDCAVKRVAQMAAHAGGAGEYDALVADLRAQLYANPPASVYSHGNFWLGNVLFDSNNTVTGVIDWDCAAEFSLPSLDTIYLLVRTHSLTRGTSFGEALADWIDADSLPFLDECLARHAHQFSIPAELLVPLTYCAWIQHLDSHCRFGTSTGTNPRWLNRNVRQVLDRWRLRKGSGRGLPVRWETAG